ncbi:Mitochondrial genome maintenance exonuclease 1 [Trichinella murrelli]|uniref:Mitochondrial genome maintenance exonuclease 1 n=2 Tax=Trichinella TaxID=6333 RepID=A0A0V0TM83_9BILA|nr:Mitochondrial genome maintenance exonuclease 1 [Trichinella murrelli]
MVSIMLCKILPFRNLSFSALSYKNVRSLSSNRYENGKATNNNRHIILEVKRNKKTISLNNRTSAANFGINIDSIFYKFPSVTKILEESRSEDGQQILIKWKQAMIEQVGTEIFEKMTADRFKLGHALHEAFSMQYLKLNTPPDEVILPENAKPYWNSMRPLLEDFDSLISKEMWVKHRKLCYKGQLDAIAHYKKKLTLIELKTSDKLKLRLENTYDTPLQLAAYAGALNSMNLDYKVTHAVIVVCYKDNEASVFELGPHYLEYYWKEWLQRLHHAFYKWASLKKKNLNKSQKKSSRHPWMNKISSSTSVGCMSRISSFSKTTSINFISKR